MDLVHPVVALARRAEFRRHQGVEGVDDVEGRQAVGAAGEPPDALGQPAQQVVGDVVPAPARDARLAQRRVQPRPLRRQAEEPRRGVARRDEVVGVGNGR